MKRPQKALLLVGSPKPAHSTSEALGGYLLEKLAAEGFAGERVHLQPAASEPAGVAGLLASVADAELVILAYPTYVDSLPAPVVRSLEAIAAGRRTGKVQPQRFLAIANCGFPEPVHNRVSLAICRQFAREAGFAWVGGLSLGGGGAVSGEPLESRKGMLRNIIRSLDMSAAALAANRPIPDTAVELMARPLMPRWLYLWIGNWGWRRQAKRFGTTERLLECPWPN